MEKQELAKLTVLLLAAVLAAMIIRPFILILLLAAIVAYALHPLYKKIILLKIPRVISSLFITSSSLLLLIIAIQYGTNIALREMGKAYSVISQIDLSSISPHLENIVRKIIEQLASWFSNQILAVPELIIMLLIFFIAMFYFLYDGERFYKEISELIPINKKEKDEIMHKIKRSINSFIYIQLLIGLLQGLIAAVGLYLFGIEYLLFGSILAAILSILPMLGSFLLYVAISTYFFLMGQIWMGVGILVYGLGLSGTIDSIIKPILFGKRTRIHPLITFIGIFGGLRVLGIAGIILGPVIISIAATLLKEFMWGYKGESL